MKKHGLIIEKNSVGNIVSKTPYYILNGDSLVDGNVIYFYPNGRVEDSFEVKDGKKNGLYFQYDSLGFLTGKIGYSNGKRNGNSYSYYSNGKLEIEEFYKNDSIITIKNFYYNGALKSYFIMKNNKESCYYLILDSLGKILENAGDSFQCKQR